MIQAASLRVGLGLFLVGTLFGTRVCADEPVNDPFGSKQGQAFVVDKASDAQKIRIATSVELLKNSAVQIRDEATGDLIREVCETEHGARAKGFLNNLPKLTPEQVKRIEMVLSKTQIEPPTTSQMVELLRQKVFKVYAFGHWIAEASQIDAALKQFRKDFLKGQKAPARALSSEGGPSEFGKFASKKFSEKYQGHKPISFTAASEEGPNYFAWVGKDTLPKLTVNIDDIEGPVWFNLFSKANEDTAIGLAGLFPLSDCQKLHNPEFASRVREIEKLFDNLYITLMEFQVDAQGKSILNARFDMPDRGGHYELRKVLLRYQLLPGAVSDINLNRIETEKLLALLAGSPAPIEGGRPRIQFTIPIFSVEADR